MKIHTKAFAIPIHVRIEDSKCFIEKLKTCEIKDRIFIM